MECQGRFFYILIILFILWMIAAFFCQTMIKNLNSLDISTELLYHLQQSNCLFRVRIMVKWIASYGTRGEDKRLT